MVWRSLLRRTVVKQIPRSNPTPILFCSDIASSTSSFPSIHCYDHSYGFFTASLSHKCPHSISSLDRTFAERLERKMKEARSEKKVKTEGEKVDNGGEKSKTITLPKRRVKKEAQAEEKVKIEGEKVANGGEKSKTITLPKRGVKKEAQAEEKVKTEGEKVDNGGEKSKTITLPKRRVKKEAQAEEKVKTDGEKVDNGGEKSKTITLPKGRVKKGMKISLEMHFGLRLNDPEVRERFHKGEEFIWPPDRELVIEKILTLNEADDPTSLIKDWVEVHRASREDWDNLLDKLKEKNNPVYLKVAELALPHIQFWSFGTRIEDYSNLICHYAEDAKYDDVDRLLKMMIKYHFRANAIIARSLIHMYSKPGNLDRTKEAFESLISYGFLSDKKMCHVMIMSYVNAGQLNLAWNLLRVLEAEKGNPCYEIYMALLQSYALSENNHGVNGAVRSSQSMDFFGFERTLETSTLLVEAYVGSDDANKARGIFDYMLELGIRPDDRVTASMISAYVGKDFFKPYHLLSELRKHEFEPGVATWTVLVDGLAKNKFVDLVELTLERISQLGEAPPLRIHVSLCDMYARVGNEKKALQALGVLEAGKDQLRQDEFERIIKSLLSGGYEQDARRIKGVMEARGFTPSQGLFDLPLETVGRVVKYVEVRNLEGQIVTVEVPQPRTSKLGESITQKLLLQQEQDMRSYHQEILMRPPRA